MLQVSVSVGCLRVCLLLSQLSKCQGCHIAKVAMAHMRHRAPRSGVYFAVLQHVAGRQFDLLKFELLKFELLKFQLLKFELRNCVTGA